MNSPAAILARLRPLRKRLALGAFSLALALALAEAACRLLARNGPADPLAGADRPATFFRVDPERQPLAAVADADAVRIAVIGDSFTVGAGVQTTDRYAAQLERMLNARAGRRPVKIKLFAYAGTSTFQQLAFLKEALRWRPDVLVLGICLNDVEDVAKPGQIAEWRSDMLPPPPPPRLAAILRRSVCLSMAYRGWAVRAARRGYVRYYRRIYDPDYSGWSRFRVAIKKFQVACADEEVPLLAVILPLMSDPFEKGRYRFEFAHEAIRALLESSGMAHLDALAAFRGKNPLRMTAIPVIDPHPSEIAHRILAETVLDRLLALGYLPEDYRPVECGAGDVLRKRWERTGEWMDPLRKPGEGNE
jgi:lysophospholipase L1-like esterase